MSKTPPFFIVCAARSGSTLLRLMLTAHPALSIPPESKFLVRLHPLFGEDGLPDGAALGRFLAALYADDKFRAWELPEPEVRAYLSERLPCTYREAVTAVYEAYAARTFAGASRLGDKNPGYRLHIDTIRAVYPEARFIHLLRDVRAVYSSTKKVAIRQGRRPLGLLGKASRRWASALEAVERHATPASFLTIRYEMLVTEPEDVLRQVCAFLEIDYDPVMLRFHQVNRDKGLVPEAHLATHHQNTLRPVMAGRVDAWRGELSEAEVEALELRHGDALRSLGYDVPARNGRLRGRLRLLRDEAEGRTAPLVSRLRKLVRRPARLVRAVAGSVKP